MIYFIMVYSRFYVFKVLTIIRFLSVCNDLDSCIIKNIVFEAAYITNGRQEFIFSMC